MEAATTHMSPKSSHSDLRDPSRQAFVLLRTVFTIAPIIFGLDKFSNLLVDWTVYLAPAATAVVPVSAQTFMYGVGVIEIIAGLIVLSRWTKFGGYLVMLWLLGIAVNLLTTGMFYDLAMRDAEIALGAFALAQLTAVRETQATVLREGTNRASSPQFAVTR